MTDNLIPQAVSPYEFDASISQPEHPRPQPGAGQTSDELSDIPVSSETSKEFARLFAGNPAAHYVRHDDPREKPYEVVERGIAVEDVLRHLNGETPSLLSIPIDADGLSHFGVIDVDRHGDEPSIDHAELAKRIADLNLPLVVFRSRGGKGAWLILFVKEETGAPAADVRKLLMHYAERLEFTEHLDFFPRQDSLDVGQKGNGVNLGYFGQGRPAFGPGGQQLTLHEFMALAQDRAVYVGLLAGRLSKEEKSISEKKDDNAPLPANIIRDLCAKNIEALRSALPGTRNDALNTAAFFVARAYAANILDKTEKELKEEILKAGLATKMPRREVEDTLRGSWSKGSKRPLRVSDPEKEECEALESVKRILASKDQLDRQDKKELARGASKLNRFDFHDLEKAMATKAKVGVTAFRAMVKQQLEPAGPKPDGVSVVLYSPGNLDGCVAASERALHRIAGKYYISDTRLVVPVKGHEISDRGVEREETSVVIRDASEETIRRDLDQRLKFVIPQGKTHQRILPPKEIPGHIRDRVQRNTTEVPYPRLNMVVDSPVLLPDGTVHDAPGELRQGVLLVASGVNYPRVPDRPSREDAIAALKKFEAIFHMFPFVGQKEDCAWDKTASYSTVLAACLTLAARPALSIAVPIFGSSAPTMRYGKTMIVDAITVAITGGKPAKITYKDEIEFGKLLQPVVLKQDRSVLIDNVDLTFRSAKLAPLITDNYLTDRVLGYSEEVTMRNRSVFFVSGNNLVFGGDLTARSLMARIDAGVERPEERAFDFHPETRARERHPELVGGALTALRAFFVAGKPWSLQRAPWGGLEEWDKFVSGCLIWAGYADPLLTRDAVITDDPEYETNVQLLQTWHDDFGERPVTISDIQNNTQTNTHRSLLDEKSQWNPRVAGWQLRRLRDRVVGGFKLTKAEGPGGSELRYWRVVRVTKHEPQNADAGREQFGLEPSPF